tara:strand:+ start:5936 stop:6148 length:213 start_codon:yes stop_codon:yes gene_type:complete
VAESKALAQLEELRSVASECLQVSEDVAEDIKRGGVESDEYGRGFVLGHIDAYEHMLELIEMAITEVNDK